MEYKRLTGQEWSEGIDLTQELGYSYIYKRLYELENKIENGTLIELPCKVGDKLYKVMPIAKKMRIVEHKVSKLYMEKNEIYIFFRKTEQKRGWVISNLHIGEDVFFTREEAEKKLKELQQNG